MLVTLLGALPMYRRVAQESPHGDGSLSMLERLLTYCPSKLLVLVLIGFVATGFVITITLSAADATAHLIENPFLKSVLSGQQVTVTLVLLAFLSAIFLKGFKEAIRDRGRAGRGIPPVSLRSSSGAVTWRSPHTPEHPSASGRAPSRPPMRRR
ncbi:MAG: hypothetical protein IPF40_15210 [Actinomycetales bacterium]|uniref:Uncharacterized protein n=1 Tax=Candidatus Phosphoribacter hodrii TaxID=2953743 RepID=A0A934X8Q7_9MICO|nr:hypothetical protein [Candidatus Phosphoribacter hodrii]